MAYKIQTRIDDADAKDLLTLASEEDRSLSSYVARLIRKHLRERLGPLPPQDEQAA